MKKRNYKGKDIMTPKCGGGGGLMQIIVRGPSGRVQSELCLVRGEGRRASNLEGSLYQKIDQESRQKRPGKGSTDGRRAQSLGWRSLGQRIEHASHTLYQVGTEGCRESLKTTIHFDN